MISEKQQAVSDVGKLEFHLIAHHSSLITATKWLERGIIGCLVLIAVCAPHSIAGTQSAWGVGMLLWVVRLLFVRPRPVLYRTPIDYALLGFFALTVLTALLSYDPDVSIGKLRAASLFTIVYFVAENIASRRLLRVLAVTLIASCMVNVVYTMAERAAGRGLKVERLTVDSPLRQAGIQDGDTLLEVQGRRLQRPEELEAMLVASSAVVGSLAGGSETIPVKVYRYEWMPVFEVPRGKLLDGATALERLGIDAASRGRDWRASGFYGHYTTYAEVLQLVLSLALGLLVALPQKRTWRGVLLSLALLGMSTALLLTVTRASSLAFLISAGLIVLSGTNKRTLLVVLLGALVVVPVGLFLLQQKRNVGFFDRKDGSITWRETVYREGFGLLVKEPRHLLVGVGMDSIKRHWREWKMFDNGRLPVGHMHSTPLQLAVERGLPTLIVWLAFVVVLLKTLWRAARETNAGDWIERGVALGALGGVVGFFVSGFVHYNLGDSEVAMVFYFIVGLALVVERFARCPA